ncbi:glycosyltransferase [Paenibacillus pinihumi]|uniref:glycosyltransferase n=1 Tax=Paenibacillus pinihumi TaxID=669462 RepID=UPI0003FD2241|nr:glycosyltransferase [Paenibacillus pinihumi]
MKVSILTVYYNRENQVQESIQSLLDQTYSDVEIIAVDDGSKDGTLKRLQAFRDPRLQVITHSNRGFTNSIIEAVKRSKGEYIAIHGSGDISYPRRIEEQVRVLDNNPETGIVGCAVDNVDTITGASEVFHKLNGQEPPLQQLLRENVYTHGEVMFRRKVYEQAGGYRPLFTFTQDFDLWLRMALITKFGTVHETLYRRYTLPDGVSASVDKMMIQQYLAELGRQNIEQRTREGTDWIDRFGPHSIFFMQRSKRLAGRVFQLAKVALWRNNDWKKAQEMIRISLGQQWRPDRYAVLCLVRLIDRLGPVKSRVTQLLRWMREQKQKQKQRALSS